MAESEKTTARRFIDKSKLSENDTNAYKKVEEYINGKVLKKKWTKLKKAKKPRRCAPAFPRVQKGG